MRNELLGLTFGRLTVTSLAPQKKHGSLMWECLCSCGKKKTIRSSHLTTGTTKSCGCYGADQRRKAITLPPGQSAFNKLVYEYKQGAKARGFEWSLTDAQARTLFNGNCDYCGVEPSQPFPKGKDGDAYNQRIVINGIDRVDNKRGYTLGNTVPCCKTCNRAKHAMKFGDFEAWLARIVAHRRHKGMQ